MLLVDPNDFVVCSVVPLILISWFLMLAVYTYTHRFLAPLTLSEFIMVAAGNWLWCLLVLGWNFFW
jgi:ABC-2 type transport system permease protein